MAKDKENNLTPEEVLSERKRIEQEASMKRMDKFSRNRPVRKITESRSEPPAQAENAESAQAADRSDKVLSKQVELKSTSDYNNLESESAEAASPSKEGRLPTDQELALDSLSKEAGEAGQTKQAKNAESTGAPAQDGKEVTQSQAKDGLKKVDGFPSTEQGAKLAQATRQTKESSGNFDLNAKNKNSDGIMDEGQGLQGEQSKLSKLGDSLQSKLGSGEKTTGGKVDQSAPQAVKDAQKVAKATSTVLNTAGTLIFNPITWVLVLLMLLITIGFAGGQILGKSDFAKNCSPQGDTQVSGEITMSKDVMERANAVADWLTSNKFKFMGNKPMTKEQAAGIVGNWSQEGGVTPTAFQPNSISNPDYYKSCDNDCVLAIGGGGGRAIGFMQWDSGRRVGLVNHAKSLKKNWYDPNVQLDWLRVEADGAELGGYSRNFKDCKDAESCAIAFCKDIERAGVPEMQNRTSFAKKFLAQYKGGGGNSSSMGDATESGNVGTCSADNNDDGGIDASSTVKLAIEIAYPTSEYSKSNTNGGTGGPQALPGYKKAKELAEKNGGKDPMPGLYASCDRFVATIMKATKSDTEIPWGSTSEQYAYFQKSPKWKEVKCADRKPGDVIITKQNGHIMLYLGKVKGQDSLASASYMDRVAAVGPFTGCSGSDWLADGWPMNGIGTTGFRLVKK